MYRTKAYQILLSIITAAAAFGCAPKTPQQAEIIYPGPPEEPRIVYLASYQGEQDFKTPGFFDPLVNMLFGKPNIYDMRKPFGVAAHGEKIYVADSGGASVLVFDRAARTLGRLGLGMLATPIGVAVAANGTVYVADVQKNMVYAFNAEGKAVAAMGAKESLENPVGLAVNDTLGRLYVTDSKLHTVFVYSLNGEFLFKFEGGEKGFYYPSGIAVDRRNGTVYVVETQNFRVQVLDQDGRFQRMFGRLGDVPGTFARPRGIAVDSEGHVYVSDAAFDNFQIFDDQGQLLLFIGGAGSAPGYFLLPAGVFVDQQDRIYVVDASNRRVQVFQYLSESWKKANPEQYRRYVEQ